MAKPIKRLSKKRLVGISKKINAREKLTPEEITYIQSFRYKYKKSKSWDILKKITLPISLLLGALIAVFPERFETVTDRLPEWTNLSNKVVLGLDYIWDIIGEPVGNSNIIYHLPNIIFYAFGIIGIKALFDALNKERWQDVVTKSQAKLKKDIEQGDLKLKLKEGYSFLFIGKGDFIGEQFSKDLEDDETVSIASSKPKYTNIWNKYDINELSLNLENVLENLNFEEAGEYVFFPVKDDQIFLPSLSAYDLAPHKLELLIKNLRQIESEHKLQNKRVIIIGDKFQKSIIRSEDHYGKVENSEDEVSIRSIAANYSNVIVVDPSEIVLREIYIRSRGRRIVFRSSEDGVLEYKSRFFYRLGLLGYDPKKASNEEFVIGYDIFEDKVEHQSISKKHPNYFPVVLSKAVYDALLKNGYKENEILYVPNIVLKELSKHTR